MSLLQQQRIDLESVIGRWQESLAAWRATGSDRDRDSAILRFELAYEVMWKHLQTLVREQGLESNGPRQAFENAFRLGWIADEIIWAEAMKARNIAVHVYRETFAEELGGKLAPLHAAFMQLLQKLPSV
jgi:nucleotidyltransferase substrate binding protein (TIGR01987 family)